MLSEAQQRYLEALERVHAEASAREVERWGKPLEWISEAAVAEELGRTPAQVIATANALVSAGLVGLRTATVASSELRRGSFGSWNGARRVERVERSVKPLRKG